MVKRRTPDAPHEEHADETWLIPYSDLLTLLLALFIVLFASSTLDKAKLERIEYSLAAAFNTLSSGKTSGSAIMFLDDLKALKLGNNVGLGSNEKGVVIEFANIDLFETGSTKIKSNSFDKLKKIADILKTGKYKRYRIIVKGHTDDRPIINNLYASNWELSSARAAVVVRHLIKLGLDEHRFQAVGMADISPKCPNLDAYGQPIPNNRKNNNRLEIDIEL